MLIEYKQVVSIEWLDSPKERQQRVKSDGLVYVKVSAYDEHEKLCDFFGYVPEDFALACEADEEMEYFEARGDDAKTLIEGRSLLPFLVPSVPVPVPAPEPEPEPEPVVDDEPVIIDGFVMPF
jgi:hypothetical protein